MESCAASDVDVSGGYFTCGSLLGVLLLNVVSYLSYCVSLCQKGLKEGQIEMAESQVADNQYKLVFSLFAIGYLPVEQWLSSLG